MKGFKPPINPVRVILASPLYVLAKLIRRLGADTVEIGDWISGYRNRIERK
jgi:hypothetical protein